MTIVVTGASGFVGAALVEDLVGRGARVVGIDREAASPTLLAAVADLPGSFEPRVADVTDVARLVAVLPEGAAAVIHTATVTAGPERDAAEPQAIVQVNVGGTAAVLQACREHAVPRMVLASSSAAYGRSVFRDRPLAEDLPCDPVSLYEVTKFAAERTARRLGALYGIEVRIARLSSVFGPWERATGVRDTLSPLFQLHRLAARGEPALLPRPHWRDWIYVRDAAAGLIALARASGDLPPLVNLGPGPEAGFTALDWGARLAAVTPGFECRVAAAGEAPNVDVYLPRDRAGLDTSRLEAATGFRCRFDAERAFADYRNWLAAHQTVLAA